MAEADTGSTQESDCGEDTHGGCNTPLQLGELRVLTLEYDANIGVADACKAYEKREGEDEEDCEGHPIACLEDLCTPAASETTTTQNLSPATNLAHSHPFGDATSKKRKRKRTSKAMKQQDPNVDHGEPSAASGVSQCALAADAAEKAEKKKEKAREAKRQRKRNKKIRLQEGPFNANVAISLGWSENHGTPDVVRTDIGANQLDAANGAWVGVRRPVKQSVTAVAEGTRGGLRVVHWDGEYVQPIRFHRPLAHTLTDIPSRSLTRTSG